jgi:antitoxin (DNA-binding transcriptional repressor) of toxin-antitoxin stability system
MVFGLLIEQTLGLSLSDPAVLERFRDAAVDLLTHSVFNEAPADGPQKPNCAVERGVTVPVMRVSHPIAEICPARRRTGADLRDALAGTTPPDDAFFRSFEETMSIVTSEVNDPWADA